MPKNTKSGSFVIFPVIVVIMLYVFFADDDQSNHPSVSPTQSGNSGSTGTIDLQPTGLIPSGPWPSAGSDEDLIMADNSLAVNYYVILDASGSMSGKQKGRIKMQAAKEALTRFCDNLPEDANLGLSTFSPLRERVPLGTDNRELFKDAIMQVQASGGTPLVKSMARGYEALTEQARKQSGYGRYILLVVTDGASSDGTPAPIAAEIVRQSAIEVQTIGFGVANHALNINGVTDYYSADSVETLIAALDRVIASETEAFVDPTDFSN